MTDHDHADTDHDATNAERDAATVADPRRSRLAALRPWAALGDGVDILPGGQRRCTAHARRHDVAADGSAAGRCARPARAGTTVCGHHGGNAAQVIESARQRLGRAARSAADVLVDLAEDVTQPGHVRRAAAADVLDRVGVMRMTADEVTEAETARARLVEALGKLRARQVASSSPPTMLAPIDPDTIDDPAMRSILRKVQAVKDAHDPGWRERQTAAVRLAAVVAGAAPVVYALPAPPPGHPADPSA